MTTLSNSNKRFPPLKEQKQQLPIHSSGGPAPSSSTTGFFQESPRVPNQLHDDVALIRASRLFLPEDIRALIRPDLDQFGARVLTKEVLSYIADAERNPPYLRTWDTWGRRQDELVTSEGWRKLQDLGLAEGIVAIAYEGKVAQYGRLYQFMKYHLWSGSNAYVTCPSAMQDGAAALLLRQLRDPKAAAQTRPIFQSAYTRLVSRDPKEAWTSGQWMTERPGGSDVRNTETRAIFAPDRIATLPNTASDGSPLGPWVINGFKWFSSATDANMSVMLAKTGDSDRISAFFAPTRRTVTNLELSTASTSTGFRPQTELNGIQIQRLKAKLGTRAVPTAELVLEGMHAHMIGAEGQGTKEISTVLNITRVHNAVTSVGLLGRGLAISRAFAKVRRTSGSLLIDVPAHVRGLAQQHVDYRANMLITYQVVALLGMVEHSASSEPLGSPPPSRLMPSTVTQAQHLLRILTPMTKALTALASIAGLRHCMESLGGVGYLENEDPELNIARMFRDANVLSIWEGTTDVMASDLIRVIKGQNKDVGVTEAFDTMNRWIAGFIAHWHGRALGGGVGEGLQASVKEFASALSERWKGFKTMVSGCSAEELRYRGQEVLRTLGWAVCAVLLLEDALSDEDEVALEVAQRWILGGGAMGWGASLQGPERSGNLNWKRTAAWDRRIVFEADPRTGVAEMSRL